MAVEHVAKGVEPSNGFSQIYQLIVSFPVLDDIGSQIVQGNLRGWRKGARIAVRCNGPENEDIFYKGVLFMSKSVEGCFIVQTDERIFWDIPYSSVQALYRQRFL